MSFETLWGGHMHISMICLLFIFSTLEHYYGMMHFFPMNFFLSFLFYYTFCHLCYVDSLTMTSLFQVISDIHSLFFIPFSLIDKNHCDTNGLVAAKVHDYSLYTTKTTTTTSQVKHVIQHISHSNGRQMDGIAENGKSFQSNSKKH